MELLILFVLLIGIAFMLYYTIKKLGYPKAGIILSSIFGILIAYITIPTIFEDELFSKSQVQELLKKQNIELMDDFERTHNKPMSAIGVHYHTFTLEISERDKERIINQIKSSRNFTSLSEPKSDIKRLTDYNEGETVIQDYETEREFVRKLLEPHGKGYSPSWRIIYLDKNENKLRFEYIIE